MGGCRGDLQFRASEGKMGEPFIAIPTKFTGGFRTVRWKPYMQDLSSKVFDNALSVSVAALPVHVDRALPYLGILYPLPGGAGKWAMLVPP